VSHADLDTPARLIVIRGNSASGKSAVAAEIRRRHGRGLAIVGQDNLRRQVLRERDVPGGANVALIDLTARFALDHGFHVIVEGILYADHYGRMLDALIAGHAELARAYYLDVPWAETLRRHATKPQAAEYGEREMRGWFRERDLLPGGLERVIPAASSLDETVRRIMAESGLGGERECPEGP
jgi:AAA domain